ncbi:MAG: peptidase M64 N-terminal domain-containing protein, partial [Acidobacteriota bacterium]
MWKPVQLALIFTLSAIPPAAAEQPFSASFEDATLRIDYYHTGNAEEESIAVDRLLRHGIWAGPRSGLAGPSPLGTYYFQARDAATGELVFAKGYDSYFAEYRTTARAAAGTLRTYHESVLLPFPRRPLVASISAR